MAEKKRFVVLLEFDGREFDFSKLTPEYVHRVTTERLGGKGIEITTVELKEEVAILREIHDKSQDWIRELDNYMVNNNDFREELVEIESMLRKLSTKVHYLLKDVHKEDEENSEERKLSIRLPEFQNLRVYKFNLNP